MQNDIEASWRDLLKGEFRKRYFQRLCRHVERAYAGDRNVFPPRDLVFHALELTPVDQVKVVIVGQDPYPNAGDAMGLAFSVPQGVRLPHSLRNVFSELRRDLGEPLRTRGDLTDWAEQGILLLNATLTVPEGHINGHRGLGWARFTNAILRNLARQYPARNDRLIFMLWGYHARKKRNLVREHCVLETSHPSPHSFTHGFDGCGHFGAANAHLMELGQREINWTGINP